MMLASCCFSSLSVMVVRGGTEELLSGLYWMVLMLSKREAETGEREEEAGEEELEQKEQKGRSSSLSIN